MPFSLSNPAISKPNLNDALIEIIFAGNALAQRYIIAPHSMRFCTICGGQLPQNGEDADAHFADCPVQRYIDAVETVRKAVR